MTRRIAPLLVSAMLLLPTEPAAWGQFERADPGQSYGTGGYPPVSAEATTPSNAGQAQYPTYSQPPGPDASGPAEPSQQESDPTLDRQHGVARISVVQGDVNVRRGENGELTAAATNAPLMAGDALQTGPGSRAEIEFDYGNLVTVAPDTEVRMGNLEYQRYQVQVALGTVIFRVIRNAGSQAEVDTPSAGVRPEGIGAYRISVFSDGTSEVTVRAGQAEMDSGSGSQKLSAGQSTLIRGTPTNAEFQTVPEIPRDQLDDWTVNRDRELTASQSYQYVSPDVSGADDLDQYGRWVPSQYGQVWAPQQVAPDWTPYSNGEWAWEDYYGWTWVDAEPWGWAPFHYGRWFQNPGFGWCWWPGAVRASLWWNPAVVGFFGWGGGFGIGFGGIGWVALAPFEIFHGWWGHGVWARGGWGGWYGSSHYWGHADIARMYRNAAYRGAAMTARFDGFGGPHQRFAPATRAQLTNATYFRGQIPVAPTRNSFQFSTRPAVSNPRLSGVMNRQFFQSRQFAARGGTGPFNSPNARSAYGQNGFGSRPSTATGWSSPQARTASPTARYEPRQQTYRGTTAVQTQSQRGGWQAFGVPSGAGNLHQGFTANGGDGGWHRFGQPPVNGSAGPRYGGSGYPAPTMQGRPAYGYGAPATRYSAPAAPRFEGPANRGYAPPAQGFGGQRFSAPPSQRFSEPRYSAPTPRLSAPSYGGRGSSAPSGGHSYSAPRYSAPSGHGGGGSARSSGGGGHRR